MTSGYMFDAGVVTVNASGTDRVLGAIQNASLKMSYNSKQLYGGNQYPVAVARGKGSVEGSAEWAEVDLDVLADLLGGTVAAGKFSLGNPATGVSPTFSITLEAEYDGQPYKVTLPKVQLKSFDLFDMKQDDFSSQKFDFEAMFDSVSGKLMEVDMAVV